MIYKLYYKDRLVEEVESPTIVEASEGLIFENLEYIIKQNSYDISRTDKIIKYRISKVKGNCIWFERLDKYTQKQRNIKLNQLGI